MSSWQCCSPVHSSPSFCAPSLLHLGDSAELILAALAERVAADLGPPAPAPAPSESLPVLLLGGQQEHHAGGHQDVPQRVGVVVVVFGPGEDVQADPSQGADSAGEQVKDPAFP